MASHKTDFLYTLTALVKGKNYIREQIHVKTKPRILKEIPLAGIGLVQLITWLKTYSHVACLPRKVS